MDKVVKRYYISLFFIVSLTFYYIFETIYQDRKNEYIGMEKELVSVTYNTVIESFKTHSEILYINGIHRDEVLEIYEKVLDANESRRDELRKRLYDTLISMYRSMNLFNLKQLHFHLPNNDSFLRFHRPERFGDNLTDIRKTVAYVNRYKTPVHGFEEGRIFNGYRFVYPLFQGEKYLGSVETSVSMKVIIDSFQKELNSQVDFVIKKSVVEDKVFDNEQINYRDAPFNREFMYENSITDLLENREIEKLLIKSGRSDEFIEKMRSGDFFLIDVNSENLCNLIIFLPIKNGITGDSVGYIVVKRENKKLKDIHLEYMLLTLFLILFAGVVLFFQYRIQKSKTEVTHQKEILEEVQEIGHLGYWEIDFIENKTTWSDELFKIVGESRIDSYELSFERLLHFIHSEDRDMVEVEFINSIKEKRNYKIYHRIVSTQGEVRYIEHECNHIIDDTGKIVQSIGTIHDITSLKTYELELEKAKNQYESLVNHIPDIVFRCRVDEDWTMLYINDSIETISGYKASDFIWNRVRSFQSIIHRDDVDLVTDVINRAVSRGREYTVEYRIVDRESNSVWLYERGDIIERDGEILIEGIINDITPQKMAYEKLQKFIDSQESIVVLTDGEEIIFSNRQFFNFFGLRDLDEFKSLYKCVCEKFLDDENFFHLGVVPKNGFWIDELSKRGQKDRLISMLDLNGDKHIFSVAINSFEDRNYIITFNDISDTIVEKIKLQNSLVRDALTGAFNRFFFESSYKPLIHSFQESEREVGVIIFDIDHFKNINDTYGHNVGDIVLKELVNRVKERIRKDEDTLIRWGGEEFLILIPVNNRGGLFKLSEHIRTHIVEKDFKDVGKVSCSFGATLYREREDIIETIERADTALYEAKRGGRDRVVVK